MRAQVRRHRASQLSEDRPHTSGQGCGPMAIRANVRHTGPPTFFGLFSGWIVGKTFEHFICWHGDLPFQGIDCSLYGDSLRFADPSLVAAEYVAIEQDSSLNRGARYRLPRRQWQLGFGRFSKVHKTSMMSTPLACEK
jgi:hypothetical protein